MLHSRVHVSELQSVIEQGTLLKYEVPENAR